ncbi:hypothetical protein WKI65_33200 [Streptomyces sp. MS1.AVA.3]|uniref:hypothetical protein n=1 Tax=Streptomyces decoyicus TaxID=249567 RepID=UPI0030C42798
MRTANLGTDHPYTVIISCDLTRVLSTAGRSEEVQPLAAELHRRPEEGQAARRLAAKTHDGREMRRIDVDSTSWLKQVIAEHGWPGVALPANREPMRHGFLPSTPISPPPSSARRSLVVNEDGVPGTGGRRSCRVEADVRSHPGRS